MKRALSILTLTACTTLSACDSPSKLAAPAPAGTWARQLAAAEPNASIREITLNADGTFVAEVSGIVGPTHKVSGQWHAAAAWREPSCWSRALEQPTELEALSRNETGKWPDRVRTSRAAISLQYWVPKGTDLPVGARVVGKDTALRTGGGPGLMDAYRRLAEPGQRPGTQAGGEQWLVEESAELIRTAVTGVKTTRLPEQVIALITECLGGGEKNVNTRLVLRQRNFLLRKSP
jgi:hypothetical protein